MKDIVLDLKGSFITDEEMESIKPEILRSQKFCLRRMD